MTSRKVLPRTSRQLPKKQGRDGETVAAARANFTHTSDARVPPTPCRGEHPPDAKVLPAGSPARPSGSIAGSPTSRRTRR